jgi:hypothetical protein
MMNLRKVVFVLHVNRPKILLPVLHENVMG